MKEKIYNIIRDDHENQTSGKIFDSTIISLIIINIILVALDTFKVPPLVVTLSYYIEIITVIVFSIEYILRLWTATKKYPDKKPAVALIKHIFSFMALVDLLAILPFYIPFLIPIDLRVLRTIRVVRLLRLFKMNRYTNALVSISEVFKKKASQLLSAMFVVFLLMIVSSILMYNAENEAQPEVFTNAFSGLWWAVATFTTVGYGDIYPITVIGKILSTLIAMLGIALVAVPTGIISAGFIEQIDSNKEIKAIANEIKDTNTNIEQKCFCPYCGKNII
ncbi:MAG: Ion transporter [Firmicutes bacterium HGW-Firmicutes-21]|nr:MAG: Ion transporter [Firmicutes bacterium HGW-Firmicutes-21]